MQAERTMDANKVFQAPASFVVLFYVLLLAWTVGTVPLVYLKFRQGGFLGDWLYGVMIGFFYLYTWFWSLGIFYRIDLDGEGRIVLKSLRRSVDVTAKQILTVEGSRFSGGFGFMKLKLPRESGYLFCHRRNKELDEILLEIRKINPLLRTVRI